MITNDDSHTLLSHHSVNIVIRASIANIAKSVNIFNIVNIGSQDISRDLKGSRGISQVIIKGSQEICKNVKNANLAHLFVFKVVSTL